VGEIAGLAAGVHHQKQPILRDIRNHEVIDDAARLVGEQRVALATRLQTKQVARHQPFERRSGAGARQRRLAHMRHVEQRCLGATVQVLGQHALVLHRHGIAGERHHARAESAVPRIEWRRLQLLRCGLVR
jgi:hypothetical protein